MYVYIHIYIYIYIVDGDESYILRNLYRKKIQSAFSTRFVLIFRLCQGTRIIFAPQLGETHEFAHLETTWNNVQDRSKYDKLGFHIYVLICLNGALNML